MNYICSLCDGRLISQHDEDGTVKCVACGAEHLWNEGLIVSERWVKTEIERLQCRQQIGWFNPGSKRFCYSDEKEAWPANCVCYSIPVFIEAAEAGGE